MYAAPVRLFHFIPIALLFLFASCSSTPPRHESPPPSEIKVGRSLREDVLARYGTPNQILLQPDEEIWIYDGRIRQGSYIDAMLRFQAAMAMPTSRPSTSPATAARDKAVQDAFINMTLVGQENSTQHEPGRFTFDRKSGRLRSITGPMPPSATTR